MLGVIGGMGGSGVFPDKHHSSSRRIETFDGKHWQKFEEKRSWPEGSLPEDADPPRRSGVISTDQARLFNFARPHMFLLESGCPEVPLSVYLKGHQATREWPGSDFREGKKLSVKYLGQEKFRELTCQKVLVDNHPRGGPPHNGWELWLSEERNYIPARRFAYTYRWSNELPVAESTIDEWKEVKPGIWFPSEAHTSRYDSFTIQRAGVQNVTWTKDVTVTRVTLDPEVDQSIFQVLEFPKGTEIRVRKAGQPTKTFVQE